MNLEEQPSQQSSKSTVWVFIIAAIAVALIAWYAVPALSARSVSANEAAAMNVQFIDTALDEKTGTFNLFFVCDKEKGTCETNNRDVPPHMGYAIMSLKGVGELTGNTAYVAKADTILRTAIERCEEDIRYCEWNFFPLYDYYVATGDPIYRDAMLKASGSVMRDRPINEIIPNNIPIKWERLYNVTKDETYKQRLTDLADELIATPVAELTGAMEVYKNGDFSVDDMTTQAVWTAIIPAYRVSNDPKYLAYAENYFDKAQIEDHVNLFMSAQLGTAALLKGLEAILDISTLDPSRASDYKAKAKKISGAILQEYWDTPERKLVNGDYGILIGSAEKTTNMQGWFTVLLLRQGEEKITLK